MTIALASDHAGLPLKRHIAAAVEALGHTVEDCGVYDGASCDYSDFAAAAAAAVRTGRCALGLLFCGTGQGMALSANKVRGIRCAVCSEPYSAQMARAHNDANMLALGARVVGDELAAMIVRVFLETTFEGGRHQRRVDKLMALEG